MSLPWDSQPRPAPPQPVHAPYTPPPQQYAPPPQQYAPQPQPYQPPPPPPPQRQRPAETMRPDVPRYDIAADMRSAVADAVNKALTEDRANIEANIRKMTAGKKKPPPPKKHDDDDESVGEVLEEAWQAGTSTKRTFFQNVAVDVGFTLMAILGTISAENFTIDRTFWLIAGTSILKTVISTTISFASKIES
jgi:hypothetical protein